jgi:putative membrane protein
VDVTFQTDGFGGFWLVGLLFFLIWLAFVGGLITLIVLGIRWLIRQNAKDRYEGGPTGENTALELLRQRYARGEIDAAEFEERKRTLGG